MSYILAGTERKIYFGHEHYVRLVMSWRDGKVNQNRCVSKDDSIYLMAWLAAPSYTLRRLC